NAGTSAPLPVWPERGDSRGALFRGWAPAITIRVRVIGRVRRASAVAPIRGRRTACLARVVDRPGPVWVGGSAAPGHQPGRGQADHRSAAASRADRLALPGNARADRVRSGQGAGSDGDTRRRFDRTRGLRDAVSPESVPSRHLWT